MLYRYGSLLYRNKNAAFLYILFSSRGMSAYGSTSPLSLSIIIFAVKYTIKSVNIPVEISVSLMTKAAP